MTMGGISWNKVPDPLLSAYIHPTSLFTTEQMKKQRHGASGHVVPRLSNVQMGRQPGSTPAVLVTTSCQLLYAPSLDPVLPKLEPAWEACEVGRACYTDLRTPSLEPGIQQVWDRIKNLNFEQASRFCGCCPSRNHILRGGHFILEASLWGRCYHPPVLQGGLKVTLSAMHGTRQVSINESWIKQWNDLHRIT